MLDNDLLLNTFHFYRPAIFDEDEEDDNHILEGGECDRERRWYKFAHVCRRWGQRILDSPPHLSLCLVCTSTFGTPVADILAHPHPLPPVIYYIDDVYYATAEQDDGIILVLQHNNRVRRIHPRMLLQNLKRFITAIDGEFPMLDLYIMAPDEKPMSLALPTTFQAPHLCHLALGHITCPLGFPLLTGHASRDTSPVPTFVGWV